MRRGLSIAVAVQLSILLIASLGPSAGASGQDPVEDAITTILDDRIAGSGESPPNRVLVVSANLQEAFDDKDVRNQRDISRFPGRLLRKTPFKPDVLLLQEIRLKSARYVAQELSKRVGDRYTVGNELLPLPYDVVGGVWVQTDTAVLINQATMTATGEGGFVKTPHPWGVKKKKMVKEHAFLPVEEDASGESMAFMSLHFPPAPGSRKTHKKLFGKWTQEVIDVLEKRYPNAAKLIGGDFNQLRKTAGPGVRGVMNDNGYKIVAPTKEPFRTDFIYSEVDGIRGGRDSGKASYSDHVFIWSLVQVP